MVRWLCWQIGSRLVPGSVAAPFVNGSRLLVSPGMTGATGNVYCGLHEFEEMSFLLHLLRPEDLFIDVGANVGSYTVLAGAAIGAECISIEPIPAAYRHLVENINLNGIGDKVEARNLGMARKKGILKFTSGYDTTNRVMNENEEGVCAAIEVKVDTLNNIAGDADPVLIKIDVEGFEGEIMEGADQVLSKNSLLAVIMEINGSCNRYGHDETSIRRQMPNYGFSAFRYHPFERRLEGLQGEGGRSQNTLFVRNLEEVERRLKSAPPFLVKGWEI